MRKTCCLRIRHACMGIFLLHLYLLCCVHGQDTSDYSGDEEYEPGYDMTGLGRCFKHQYWCLKQYEWEKREDFLSQLGRVIVEGTLASIGSVSPGMFQTDLKVLTDGQSFSAVVLKTGDMDSLVPTECPAR